MLSFVGEYEDMSKKQLLGAITKLEKVSAILKISKLFNFEFLFNLFIFIIDSKIK